MKVLVIDDDRRVASAIEQQLGEHEVWIERDASQGLARALKAAWEGIPYDVVMCEEAMHGLPGTYVLASLNAHADPPACVLMCDHADKRASADFVLTKPIDRETLKTLMQRIERERTSSTTRRIRRFATGAA